ncbi:MAG: hypothetical protein ABEJ79_02260 [Halolamina sp.]
MVDDSEPPDPSKTPDPPASASGSPPGIDPEALAAALRERYGGDAGEATAVARQARDLADDGRLRPDRGGALTAESVVTELADAPDGGPADRWNWWVGALAVAYGDAYRRFQVRRYESG